MGYGERIKEMRKKHNLNQKELAEAIGILPQSLIKYEKGKSSFTLKFREKLLKVFSEKEVEYIEYGKEKARMIISQSGKHAEQYNAEEMHDFKKDSVTTLTHDEITLLENYRELDKDLRKKLIVFALTGECK